MCDLSSLYQHNIVFAFQHRHWPTGPKVFEFSTFIVETIICSKCCSTPEWLLSDSVARQCSETSPSFVIDNKLWLGTFWGNGFMLCARDVCVCVCVCAGVRVGTDQRFAADWASKATTLSTGVAWTEHSTHQGGEFVLCCQKLDQHRSYEPTIVQPLNSSKINKFSFCGIKIHYTIMVIEG